MKLGKFLASKDNSEIGRFFDFHRLELIISLEIWLALYLSFQPIHYTKKVDLDILGKKKENAETYLIIFTTSNVFSNGKFKIID